MKCKLHWSLEMPLKGLFGVKHSCWLTAAVPCENSTVCIDVLANMYHLESVINIWVPIIETLLMFGERRDWCRPQKHVPTVKRGRGSIRLWVCFSPSGTGNLVKVEGIIKKDTYVIIWKEKIKQPNLDLSNRFVTFSFVWKTPASHLFVGLYWY